MKIGFVGLTHLGLVYLAAAASKNIKVVGYHYIKKEVDQLKIGILEIQEPQLNQYLRKFKKNIIFTNSLSDIIQCEIVFISVDIPTNAKGVSNYSKINKLINTITKVIKKKTILVILSQVNPGYTRKIKWPSSNLFYQVETLIFGKAIKRAIKPERIIIGGNFDISSKKVLPKEYSNFLKKFKCKIIKMNYESAELTKLSINLFLISNISIANNLSEICSKINANWKEIIPALKLDKRIGKYAYVNAGLGLSGGNLERDLRTVYNLSLKHNSDFNTISAFFKTSNYYKSWVLTNLKKHVYIKYKKPNICILGLAYKANTNSIKNSPSIDLINKSKFSNLKVFDPMVKRLEKSVKKIIFKNNIYDAIEGCDVLIIMTPWQQFKKIDPNKVKSLMRGNFIIDPFNVFNTNLPKINQLKYFSLGKN